MGRNVLNLLLVEIMHSRKIRESEGAGLFQKIGKSVRRLIF